jgi:hypothetical protein
LSRANPRHVEAWRALRAPRLVACDLPARHVPSGVAAFSVVFVVIMDGEITGPPPLRRSVGESNPSDQQSSVPFVVADL